MSALCKDCVHRRRAAFAEANLALTEDIEKEALFDIQAHLEVAGMTMAHVHLLHRAKLRHMPLCGRQAELFNTMPSDRRPSATVESDKTWSVKH